MAGIQELFSGFRASASGMAAERARIDVIARNIANARTTHMPGNPEPTPYRRQVVHFEPILRRLADGSVVGEGVRVAKVTGDFETDFSSFYDPGNPDADESGVVRMPNVDTTREMADLITALRSYEANMKAQEHFVRMAERALALARR